eukprot:TRINITY_DN622_c2_g1_i1.p1 TRINITY_DN622_c2_g1~~TRINITY_DN622_c2_g1_i1.p1  ORF type:complete len:798 (-),score=167.80 TRINITY_DN622_c2_g1_i1:291-2684(-)
MDDRETGESASLLRRRTSAKSQESQHVSTLNPMQKYEALDYDVSESRLYQEQRQAKSRRSFQEEKFVSWVVVFLIGVCTGLVGAGIDCAVRSINKFKFNMVESLIDDTHNFYVPFLVYCGMNLVLVSVAGYLVVWIEPLAAGSGIPEIKSYLNGTKIKNVVRLKTLVSKAFGVLFSVSSGLCIGKEGPMIHSGAIIAGGVSQFGSRSLHLETKWYSAFRNDHDKRDFVSSGAGAGVASAFGAPTGGALFSLEEAASFWNQELTWKTYFACMICTFSLNVVLSGTIGTGWGQLSEPGLITFGSFKGEQALYKVWELPLFLLLGTFGGLTGAIFNAVNKKISIWRLKRVNSWKWRRFTEVLLVSILTSVFTFVLPYIHQNCMKKPPKTHTSRENDFKRFYCREGEYSDLASLFFTSQEDSIKTLFHRSAAFHIDSLLIFAPAYFILAVVTYGIGVPSGLFVPCLLFGASMGRLYGNFLQNTLGWDVQAGTYALMGASAFLGGVARMTISLTVILLEATNDISYGLPIMLTIMVAKLVGDVFNIGLYDIHIFLKHVPFLEWEPPIEAIKMKARDVMSENVTFFMEVEKVSTILHTLTSTTHNGFPVVSRVGPSQHRMAFKGVILRGHLLLLLKERAFQNFDYSIVDDPNRAIPPDHVGKQLDDLGDSVALQSPSHYDKESGRQYRFLTAHEFQTKGYPRPPKLEQIDIREEDMDMYIDLNPYWNPYPLTVNEETSLTRVYNLFRTVGLRHLCVVNMLNQVVGIITRKDLTEHEIEHAFERLKRRSHRKIRDVRSAPPIHT